jgi:hypothetical protein
MRPSSTMLAVLIALAAPGPILHPAQSGVAAEPESARPEAREPWFRDISAQTKTLFEHEDGFFSYAMGSGLAWIDIEEDGDEDLLLLSSSGSGAVLRNDGAAFADVSATSGIAATAENSVIGVICADYDQDGFTDAYYCKTGPNSLYRNLGGTFVDVAEETHCAGPGAWSTSASFADFDLDGDLDLYVGNYIRQLNFPYHFGSPNFLFENRGPLAPEHFVEVARELDVDNTGTFGPSVPGFPYISPQGQPTAGCTLATCTHDYDEDGDPDLMVGNDFGIWVLPNALYRNDQSGGGMLFTDVSSATGFDTRPHYNMGIAPADYDHDGDWDFYKSNLGDNLLLRNDGGVFVDATYVAGPVSGVSADGLLISSWGIVFQDLDNDSFEDLLVANGYIPAATFIDNEVRAEDHLWRNRGDGTFEKVAGYSSGMADEGPGRAVACSDWNGDGKLDYYLQNNGADYVAYPGDKSRLFLNVHPAEGAWLELDLVGRISNREGFGTRIDAEIPGTLFKRQVTCDPVFLSNPTRMVHLGLGAAERVSQLTVRWPSGIVQHWLDVPARQRLELREPAVTVVALQPLSYAAGAITLAATLENHDAHPQEVQATFRAMPAGFEEVVELNVQATLPAGATQTVAAAVSVSAAAYADLQGAPVHVRVDALADGSKDSAQAELVVP